MATPQSENISDVKEKPSVFSQKSLAYMLPLYYKRLFPHKQFYQWISYGEVNKEYFRKREFSFTLADDIYIRYLSFDDQNEFEKELYAKAPEKIDIGPVMDACPKQHLVIPTLRPVEKELVFDIDMTDYDNVRTCCSGADVCTLCWKFMAIACKVIDATLREDFGYELILWVFSGRRGIHCWVCDQAARALDSKSRACLAEYINIMSSGGVGSNCSVHIINKMHHSIKRSLKIIEPYFEEVILQDQNLFTTPKGLKRLLSFIPDETLKREISEQLAKIQTKNSSKEIWAKFERHVQSAHRIGSVGRKLKFLIEEIQLSLLYPRLDINVTKGLNHLLKAPFCVHPKTGKVCVPFNPNLAHKFDPTTVPTIDALIEEINQFDATLVDDNNTNHKSKIKDYKKTKMLKGVMVFEEFLRKIESKQKLERLPPPAVESMEF